MKEQSVSYSEYLEVSTKFISQRSSLDQQFQQTYGISPTNLSYALHNIEGYKDIAGQPILPLNNLKGEITGLKFIDLDKRTSLKIGNGFWISNQETISNLPVLITDDLQSAFKLSKSKYLIILLDKLDEHVINSLTSRYRNCCVITECHQLNNIKRRLYNLNIRVIGISLPITPFTDIKELEKEIDLLISQCSRFHWKQPKKIEAELLPVEPFNPTMLPLTLLEYVMDSAKRADNMPPDFVAVSILLSLCSLVGARVSIKPKRNDDWCIAPNLWGGIVAPPASKKTPAFNAGTYPLDILVKQAYKEYEKARKNHELSCLFRESQQKNLKEKLKNAIKKGELSTIEKLKAEFLTSNEVDEELPPIKRYKTNDASPEALAELEKNNPNGILVCRDELVGLLSSLERNDNDSGRSFYLEGWNGNKSYEFDRIMRGSGYIQNHCLSILGGIQPDKLIYFLEPSIKGMGNDGLFQRFQLLVYPDPLTWEYVDQIPNKYARDRVVELFKTIDKLTHNDLINMGANIIEDKDSPTPYFKFSDEAQEEYISWSTWLHKTVIPNEEHSIIAQHLDKYPKLVNTLALVFHLVECIENNTSGDISKLSLKMSLQWSKYLESHARRIYGLVLQSSSIKAMSLCKKLLQLKYDDEWLQQGFSTRSIQRKNWKGLTDLESVKDALDILIESNWILAEEIESSDKGGRPTTRYWINPKIYED